MQLARHFPPLLRDRWRFWLAIAAIAVLYGPVLIRWYDGWLNKDIGTDHEYFSHGVIGLPFAAYIAWQQRHQWERLEDRTHPVGPLCLGLASAFFLGGTMQLVNLSFPLILIGLCLWFKGWPGLKLQGFPLVLVVLATPTAIPYLITPYTLPLQTFIAGVAAFLLVQFGLDVSVEQIYLTIGGRVVEVAPYCAGLKLLFTSLYVALMLLYWTGNLGDRRRTSLLMVGAIAISITANIFRNAALAFLHGTGRDRWFDWLHEGWGGDLYLAATLGIIMGLLNLLEQWDNQGQATSADPGEDQP